MDYKEKYEQALEVAQRFCNNSVAITKKGLEDIFPELKESIDERIKKVIKQVLSESTTEKDECYLDNGVTQQEVFAWIESQGEQPKKHDVCDNCDQQGCCVSPCPMKLVEKQGEQKPVDKVEPKFKVGDVIRNKWSNHTKKIVRIADDNSVYFLDDGMPGDYISAPISNQENWVLVEQKSAWSEEDEMFVHGLIRGLSAKKDIHGHTTFSSDCIDITETINWLKSIKDRVQPKQEWSDVDKNILSRIIDNLMFIRDTISIDPNYAVNISDTEREITWLKSLKNKVQPKQEWSEEDDAVLDALIRHLEGEDIHVSPHLAVKCLKSLKNRVQPKQEWSEEDEDIKETIIGELELVKKSVGEINYNGYDKLIDWLKSLRPQNTWKPSDEQMEALEKVTNYSAFHDAKYCVELKRLLGQLKAL